MIKNNKRMTIDIAMRFLFISGITFFYYQQQIVALSTLDSGTVKARQNNYQSLTATLSVLDSKTVNAWQWFHSELLRLCILRSVYINFNYIEVKLHLGIKNKKLSFLFCYALNLH